MRGPASHIRARVTTERTARLAAQAAVTFLWGLSVFPLAVMVFYSAAAVPGGGAIPHAMGPDTVGEWSWENYRNVWSRVPLGIMLGNSLLVALLVVGGQLLTSSVAGYLFARVPFPGRRLLFALYLLSMLVPVHLTLIPSFRLLSRLGLVDTRGALVLPFIAGALGTLIMRQQFLSIPRDLEEAALLDGAGRWALWRHVLLPLVTPGLRAVAMIVFLFSWNDLLWPLVMTHRLEVRTLPVGLALLRDETSSQWPLLMAACVVAAIPALIIVALGMGGFRRLEAPLWLADGGTSPGWITDADEETVAGDQPASRQPAHRTRSTAAHRRSYPVRGINPKEGHLS